VDDSLARGKEILTEDLPDDLFSTDAPTLAPINSGKLEDLEREQTIRVLAASSTMEEA
jgi:hypothetical protein